MIRTPMSAVAVSADAQPFTRQSRGFSIIELLVVIGVIAILLALLMPVGARMREQARVVECAANLRALGTSFTNYAADNDGTVPPLRQWINLPFTRTGWDTWFTSTTAVTQGLFYRYNPNASSYVCPTFRAVCGQDDPVFSYSMNWVLGNPGLDVSAPFTYLRLSAIPRSSALMMFGEENPWTYANGPQQPLNDSALCAVPTSPNFVDGLGTFHLTSSRNRDKGVAQIIFVDGHVETRRTSESGEVARGGR